MGACFSTNNKTFGESLKSSIPVNGHATKDGSGNGKAGSRANSGKKKGAAGNVFAGRETNVLDKPLKSVTEDYEIGKELGRGLFGVTRIATHKLTRQQFACKSISKKRITLSNHEVVRREIKILQHVSGSSKVASLVEALEDENHVHLILELCTGGMLYDSITAKGSYSEQQAASMLRSMVEIVQYIHSKGVIHRDLKLENFLLASPEEDAPLKVIDFGLSTFFSEGDTFSDIVGSAYYVAPEVLERHYGPECDMWSIGVILYMLLCGVPPFWDVSDAGICRLVLKGEYDMSNEPWPSISESAKDLVRKLLEKDPKKRLTASQILENEWVRKDGCATATPIPNRVLARVKDFMLMNRMKRYAMAVIAEKCLDPAELQIIQTKFDRLDANKDGLLTLDEVFNGLKALNVQVSDEEIRGFFEAADVDQTGTLTFPKYASAIMIKRMDQERIQMAFEGFDRNNKGFITASDLEEILPIDAGKGSAEAFITEWDHNKDGKLDFHEFEKMMMDGIDTGSAAVIGNPTVSKLEDHYACGPINLSALRSSLAPEALRRASIDMLAPNHDAKVAPAPPMEAPANAPILAH